MAKSIKPKQPEFKQSQEPKAPEMTLAEARAYRAARHVPQAPVLSEDQKREEFRIFWASNKAKYGEAKSIEKALWLHLKTIGMNSPEQFLEGCAHFGLVKTK